MIDSQPYPIIISGSTASGKSELSLLLAEAYQTDVINIDSVQVYKEADIGSAKLSRKERRGISHHLLDICSPDTLYTAGDYLRDVEGVVEGLQERGKHSVLVGGSTMYISLFLEGLGDLPAGNATQREYYEQKSSTELLELLRDVDPEMAEKLHQNDRVRMIRALEIYALTGESLSSHRQKQENAVHRGALMLVLCWSREELYERINLRSRKLVDDGIIAETERLLERYGEEASPLKSLGYAQAVQYLKNEVSSEELPELIAQQTRRYAKRQMTFWRNEPRKRGWDLAPELSKSDRILGDEPGSGAARKGEERKGIGVFSWSYERLWQELQAFRPDGEPRNTVWYLDASALLAR